MSDCRLALWKRTRGARSTRQPNVGLFQVLDFHVLREALLCQLTQLRFAGIEFANFVEGLFVVKYTDLPAMKTKGDFDLHGRAVENEEDSILRHARFDIPVTVRPSAQEDLPQFRCLSK